MNANEPWMRALQTDPGYLLYRLGLRSGQLFNAALQEHGLRLRHHAVLRYLGMAEEGALQRELSTRLGYDPSAMVALVDDLQKAGLAERRPSPGDRRNRVVHLTDEGRAFLKETETATGEVSAELLAPLGPDERATLLELLQRIAEPGLAGQ